MAVRRDLYLRSHMHPLRAFLRVRSEALREI